MDNVAEEWMAELQPEDVPQPYRRMATLIGMEATLVLAQEYAGAAVYLPKLDSALRAIRDRRIRAEYTPYNVRELAHRYNLTDEWVRKIAQSGQSDGQIDIFELLPEAAEKDSA